MWAATTITYPNMPAVLTAARAPTAEVRRMCGTGRELRDRIIVAGGGGGQGPGESLSKYDQFGCGGSGGGHTAVMAPRDSTMEAQVPVAPAAPKVQAAPAEVAANARDTAKSPVIRAATANVASAGRGLLSNGAGPGGGGGGGYFGGGGGGGGCPDDFNSNGGGGGGGGSAYAEPSAKQVHIWENWKDATGYGLVTLSW